MLDFLLAMLAATAQGADGAALDNEVAAINAAPAVAAETASEIAAVEVPTVATQPISGVNLQGGSTVAVASGQGEPQIASGKFTTAVEVKPILTATKGNWVAVRDFNGQDLVYVTHIWSWRCGLVSMSIGLNDEPLQNWPLPPCHEETAVPNAILEQDGLPYLTLRQGSVQRVIIEVTYDDLTTDQAEYQRAQILMP